MLSKTAIEQLLVINALDKDELTKYMKTLLQVYMDSDRPVHDVESTYNYEFFFKVEKDLSKLIICTALIFYVRANGFDPCSLWVSIYNSGGHLFKKPR